MYMHRVHVFTLNPFFTRAHVEVWFCNCRITSVVVIIIGKHTAIAPKKKNKIKQNKTKKVSIPSYIYCIAIVAA